MSTKEHLERELTRVSRSRDACERRWDTEKWARWMDGDGKGKGVATKTRGTRVLWLLAGLYAMDSL